MRYTENYELVIIDGTDVISRVPHNESMEKIDEQLNILSEDTAQAVAECNTIKTQIEEDISGFNEHMEETEQEILDKVNTTLESAINVAPIVAGSEILCDVSGTAQYVNVAYHSPKALPINKQRKAWTENKPASEEHGDYFATVPYSSGANPTISIIKQGLYRIDLDFTIEFNGIGDGTSAMISLVKNASISGTTVEGEYLKSKYVDLNGDGKQTIHLTAYVRQNTSSTIIITPICDISGGTGAYDIVISDTEPITTTVTKVN